MQLTQHEGAILDELVRREKEAGKTTLERWCPQKPTPKQQEFLDCNAFEVLFGGAAGPGKSSGLLMAALQYVDEPDYAALIIRKTYADLALPGAIMDRSHEWLGGTAAHWNGTDKTWRFPSGATLTFGYLDAEKDKYRYQGSEIQLLGVDELTQFQEPPVRYLMSRLRKVEGSNVPIRFRAASNPGGIGHKWVYDRFVNPKTRTARVFIPARLSDNLHVDVVEYRNALAQLDETTRRQLEDGEWIEDTQGLVYKFARGRNLIDELPEAKDWQHVLGIDFGASLSEPTTSFSVWAFSVELGVAVLVLSYKKAGLSVTDIAEHWHSLDSVFHPKRTVADHGALGRGYIREMRQRHGIPVADAKKSDKFGHIKILNGDLERGVALVLDGRTEDWVSEATSLLWDDTGLKEMKGMANHCTDSAQYAYREARHFLHQTPEPLPAHGTKEYYDREEREMERRTIESIENTEGDMLGELFA